MIPQRENHIAIISFGLAVAAFAAFQQFKLPVVLPVLLEDYQYDRTLAGGFMSIYAFVGLLFSVMFGRIVSHIGAFGPLLAGLSLFAAGNFLSALWPQIAWVMLLGRALEGFGFTFVALVGPVLANAHASPKHLPIIAGLTAAWIPSGQLFASLLAPFFLNWSGWKGLWWFAAIASLGFMIWAVSLHKRDSHLFTSPANLHHEKIDRKRMPAPQLLSLLATGAIFMFWAAQYFAYMTWLPQFLIDQHHLALSETTLGYIVPVSLVMAFCVATGGLLRMGMSLPWLLIAALSTQSAVWWLLPVGQPASLGLVSLVVYGISAGLTAGCLFALPSVILGSGQRTAIAFGIVMTGRNIGVLAGPMLVAWTFSLIGSWELASPVFGVVTSACLPCAALLLFHLKRIEQARRAIT